MVVESELINEVKAASHVGRIYEILSTLQFAQPSSRLTAAVHKRCQGFETEANIRIALLANFTLDMLPPHISTAFAAIGQHAACYVAPYNQYYQEVLSETSQLKAFEPDLVLLSLAMQELSPDIHYRFAELSSSQRDEQAENVLDHVLQWVDLASEHTSAEILVTNFVTPADSALGIADLGEEETEKEFYQRLNSRLRKKLAQNTSVCLVDIDSLVSKIGWEQGFDAKMYYLAKILWSDLLLHHLGQCLAKSFIALQGKAKKCLVLDLDNTLWGGILGEDGITGIKIGKGDPVSEAFSDFQHRLKSLKQRGVILALCSKNNQDDVVEVFSEKNDMPLSMDDFAGVRINWNMKHENISEIADELNIGLDSMVFIDDNPAEISLVKQMIPEVTSLLLPSASEQITDFVDSIPLFEKRRVIESDRNKTKQYTDNRKRVGLKDRALKLDDYLRSLGTNVSLRPVEPGDLPRIHQLFTKTNQFNLTTIRYSLKDIESLLESEGVDLWCYSVDDTFGDLGLVGLLLVRRHQNSAEVDSFIMSCRTMGRGVEIAILNWLKKHYFLQLGYNSIIAKYIATNKNLPVKDLYQQQGFVLREESDNEFVYELVSENSVLANCDWINFTS